MEPTQTPTPESRLHRFKKLALPLAIIAVIVLVILIFVRGSTSSQGASLFRGVNKTNSLKVINNAVQYPGSNAVPCLVGDTTPRIKVISPNGGEIFNNGQEVLVTWSTCNIPGGSQIAIVLQDAVNQGTISLGNGQAADGSVKLAFPAGWYDGLKYKILARWWNPATSQYVDDYSDNLFAINGSSLACLENNPRKFKLLEDELALATTTHPNNGNPNIANLGDFKIDPTETVSICMLKGVNVFASANPIAPLSSVRIVDVATNQVIGSTGSFTAPTQQGESWSATIPVNGTYSLEPGKRFRIEGVMRAQPLVGTTNMLTLGITGFKAGTNSVDISTVMDLYSRVLSLQ